MGEAYLRVLVIVGLLSTGIGAVAQDSQPLIRSVMVEEVAPLTGPNSPSDMRTPDICGTDIGTMAELDGKLYLAFGDTFGYRGEACPRFGPNWRSNVLAMTRDLAPSDGIVIDEWHRGADGAAVAVTEGAHEAAFQGEQTRIPTAMVAVADRLYLHFMSVHGFAAQGGVWECNFSRFLYSDDGGEHWREAPEPFDGPDGDFGMLALSAQPGEGNENGSFVYALATPCGRFGGVRAARVAAAEVLDNGAWQYFDGEAWIGDRSAASEVIPAPVGEGSLVWNQGLRRWLFGYLNEETASLELREAPRPWGPWSDPVVLTTAREHPQLYGAFMTPSFIEDDGKTLYFVMSRFGPYNTFLMRAELAVAE